MATAQRDIFVDTRSNLRVPPHSVEAEQSVLGGVMINPIAWDCVAESVVERDFYRADHRLIFRALENLSEKNSPLDIVTVSEWLEQRHLLKQAGGMAYIGVLAKDTPSAANIAAYSELVKKYALLRELSTVGFDIANLALSPNGRSVEDLLDHAEQSIFNLSERGPSAVKGFKNIQEVLSGAIDRIDEIFNSDDPITGLSTGFSEIDDITAGLQPSDLIIVAARPSAGKTSFAMNIAEHAAVNNGKSVAIFSMEMSGEQIATRMISSLGGINQQNLRTGNLTDPDWTKMSAAISRLRDAKLFVDDTPGQSPMDLRSRSRRLMREYNLDLIVVDYLQLMTVPGFRENRTNEISEISRSLKSLAKELNIPVVALSQLNRSLESRSDKRPILSDLRESGSLEQDADVIMFIYRDELYNDDSPDSGFAEIIIRKQRNGPVGMRKLHFINQYTRFQDN